MEIIPVVKKYFFLQKSTFALNKSAPVEDATGGLPRAVLQEPSLNKIVKNWQILITIGNLMIKKKCICQNTSCQLTLWYSMTATELFQRHNTETDNYKLRKLH